MRRLFLLVVSCLVMSMVFASAAMAQGDNFGCPPNLNAADLSGTGEGETSCITDAELGDLLACEGNLSQAEFEACLADQEPAETVTEPADDVAATQYADDDMTALPDTSGPALMPIAGGLALAGLGGLLFKRRLT